MIYPIPEFLWDGDVFDNRWYYSDFHGLLGLTFPTRIKHTVLNKSLESKVYCGYSGGNGNRGEIGFAYFLAILPFYEKSCIWLFIWMPQKCCVWVSSVSAVCLQ